jgi:DNA-binding MurR/RpiR family transcriptional regulator
MEVIQLEKHPDLIKVIQKNYSKLSKGQKIIANYIINDYDKAAFMTAAKLGETLNISESTVVRFSIKLGYDGYRDLQNQLQELIKNKLTTLQRLDLADSDYDTNEDTLIKIMEKDLDNIQKTINEIDTKAFQKALDLILNAENIYTMGLRSSSFLAGYLSFYLNFVFDNIKLVSSGPNDVFEQLLKVNSNDVIIIITYPRYSKRTLEVLNYVKEKGATIIAITDSFLSPATEMSDVSLIASSEMLSFVDSLVAPMSLINSLIVSLGIEKRNELNSYFQELEEIWKRYNIYKEDI